MGHKGREETHGAWGHKKWGTGCLCRDGKDGGTRGHKVADMGDTWDMKHRDKKDLGHKGHVGGDTEVTTDRECRGYVGHKGRGAHEGQGTWTQDVNPGIKERGCRGRGDVKEGVTSPPLFSLTPLFS